jgi:hypothetical protein
MIKKHRGLCVALACVLAATATQAMAAKKIRLKPGLWQIDSQTALYGHVVPDVYAIISHGPVALQNHVNAMLLQNRVRLDENGTATVCVTARQIARNQFVNDQGSGCSVSKGRRSSNNIHFDITCEAPKGSGQTDLAILSNTQWVATSRIKLTVRNLSQDVDNKSYGTWLGDTCPQGQ